MHVLFVHENFPAQFGQVAVQLARVPGNRCTFVSSRSPGPVPGIEHIQYKTAGGAQQSTHFCSRTFENQTWSSHALYEAMRQRPDIRPDLIVAHSGFVSSLFLRELYPQTPQIGYFEYFYRTHDSDVDFRHDLQLLSDNELLRCRARNAQLLLDLHNCDAGYTPTQFQRAQLPQEYQPKVRQIFDGIDIGFWKQSALGSRTYQGITIPADSRMVTYVSRGFESLRGFDIFLQAADRICRARPDVHVVVVGEDRVCYGGDSKFIGQQTFKEWTINKYRPDLSRIHFVGRLPPDQLVNLFSISDVHLYLTGPFVLSWSLMNALSCSCVVLASDTAPVREVIQQGQTGLLADFFDVEAFTETALRVLKSPDEFRHLGIAGRQLIESRYSLPDCLQQLQQLFRETVDRGTGDAASSARLPANGPLA